MSASPAPAVNPRRTLAQIMVGNQIQQAVYVAAKLGIADVLKDGPLRSEEISTLIGAHPGSLYRLLRLLVSLGIFSEDENGRFDITPVALLLQKGTPSYSFALWSGGLSYRVFGALEHSVRTGEPAFEHLFGMEFFEYLNQNPELADLFDDAMSWHTSPIASVIAAQDFSGTNTVVDVAGGRGELLAAILRVNPGLRGVLIDHPRVIESARSRLEAAGVADRCTVIGGDVLRSEPPRGDVYLLKSVIHGLDDDDASRLLANCRKAMNNGGKVLLVEFILPPGNDPFPGKLMDLLMLVGGKGRERTREEFSALFVQAGLRLAKVETTKFLYSVLEGTAG
jgi:O-methyltransferase domain/Dimerisation domain